MKYYLNHNYTNIGQHTFYVSTNDMDMYPVTDSDVVIADYLIKELEQRLSELFNEFLLDNNLTTK